MGRRETKFFRCSRCGTVNPDYLSFGVGTLHYCLHHIPRLVRLKMWLWERVLGAERVGGCRW